MALKSSNKKSSKTVTPVKATTPTKAPSQKKPVAKAAAPAPKAVASAPKAVASAPKAVASAPKAVASAPAPKAKPFVAAPVRAKQTITFSYFAPQAGSVLVAGDFTKWEASPISLVKEETGVWKTTVTLKPGKYQYRLLVDGQWQNDPECSELQPNEFGSANCVLSVAA